MTKLIEKYNIKKEDMKELIVELAKEEWDADFTNADFSSANLKGADFTDANLKEADLDKANLEGAKLWDANLEKAILKWAKLQGANLKEANLKKADLEYANLEEAQLWDANLKKANLKEAKLKEANLWDANLEKANLKEANLKGAKLWRANLQKADLEEANLKEAQLRDADLRSTKIGDKIKNIKKDKNMTNTQQTQETQNTVLMPVVRDILAEIETRTVLVEFDEGKDSISEVYNSYYKLFSELRALLKKIDISFDDGIKLFHEIINYLNNTLRKHLTTFQKPYREWLESEQKTELYKNEVISQKKYSEYEDIIAGLIRVREETLNFKDAIIQIAKLKI